MYLLIEGDPGVKIFNRQRKNSFALFQQNTEGIFGRIRSSTIRKVPSSSCPAFSLV
jgi:hypothetical protein